MKKVLTFVLLFLCIILSACISKTIYMVSFLLEEDTYLEVKVESGDCVSKPKDPVKVNAIFDDWYVDDKFQVKFDFDTIVKKNMVIYGNFLNNHYLISFDTNGGSEVDSQVISQRGYIEEPISPTKEGYVFSGWFKDTSLTIEWDFDNNYVVGTLTLYAKWENDPAMYINIIYDLGEGLWINKDALFVDFYSYFYNFLVYNTNCNMKDIDDVNDFLLLAKTWDVNGRSNMYHFGDRFANYFITVEEDGVIEDQPTDTFVGYCYKNNRFVNVLKHIIVFFAYWRTDEGYSQSDIHGNDFFYSPWASLVDTAKFFYFTSDTLNEKYAWFNSARVKDALDNIPGVGIGEVSFQTFKKENFTLPINIPISGYSFEGWYFDANFKTKVSELTSVFLDCDECSSITVYGKYVSNE